MHRDFSWRRLARSLAALRLTPRWLSRCFVLNVFCALARCLFPLTCCFLPLFLSFLFCSLRCIVPQTPPFGVPSFRPQQESGLGSSGCCGVGVRRILLPLRLCRGESHSGASPTLSPLLPGRLHARLLSVFCRTHSHPLPALVSFCLLLLRIRLFASAPAGCKCRRDKIEDENDK